MSFNQFPQSLTLEQMEWMANYAKRAGKDAAMPIKEMLNVMCRGENAPEKWELIDGISDHYEKETEESIEERIKAHYDKFVKKYLGLPELGYVSDEQILMAIKQTEPYMKGHSSWCGIYVVLVSMCKWPENFDGFEVRVRRLEQMGLNLSEEKRFTYQGLQKGWNKAWPVKYEDWQAKQDGNATFEKHKTLANIFLKNLEVQKLRENI